MRNLTPQLVGVIVFIGLFASTGYFLGSRRSQFSGAARARRWSP